MVSEILPCGFIRKFLCWVSAQKKPDPCTHDFLPSLFLHRLFCTAFLSRSAGSKLAILSFRRKVMECEGSQPRNRHGRQTGLGPNPCAAWPEGPAGRADRTGGRPGQAPSGVVSGTLLTRAPASGGQGNLGVFSYILLGCLLSLWEEDRWGTSSHD